MDIFHGHRSGKFHSVQHVRTVCIADTAGKHSPVTCIVQRNRYRIRAGYIQSEFGSCNIIFTGHSGKCRIQCRKTVGRRHCSGIVLLPAVHRLILHRTCRGVIVRHIFSAHTAQRVGPVILFHGARVYRALAVVPGRSAVDGVHMFPVRSAQITAVDVIWHIHRRIECRVRDLLNRKNAVGRHPFPRSRIISGGSENVFRRHIGDGVRIGVVGEYRGEAVFAGDQRIITDDIASHIDSCTAWCMTLITVDKIIRIAFGIRIADNDIVHHVEGLTLSIVVADMG